MKTRQQIMDTINEMILCNFDEGEDGLAATLKYGALSFHVIASWGLGWDHVSVSMQKQTPSWSHMCFVKNLFFLDSETVIQYHPAKTAYVNVHKNCLHLWRPQTEAIPLPLLGMV